MRVRGGREKEWEGEKMEIGNRGISGKDKI